MIKLEKKSEYKKELLEQIDEYKTQKIFTKKEAGIALYMKVDIMNQFGILDVNDAVELSKIIVKEFNLNLEELDAMIF